MDNIIENKTIQDSNQTYSTDFLLILEDYRDSYANIFKAEPEISKLSYDQCSKHLFSKGIYYGDAYLHAMDLLGVTGSQVFAECRPLQEIWAQENNIWIPPSWMMKRPLQYFWSAIFGQTPKQYTCQKILDDQLDKIKPKYIWCFSGYAVSKETVQKWRSRSEKVILWWSCPLEDDYPYEEFDLILSCIPGLVEHFQNSGINSFLMPHAFDARILEKIPAVLSRIPKVAFVGSLTPDHHERVQFLDALSRQVGVDFFGTGVELLPKDSPLRQNYHGPVWGKELYSVYGSYQVVFHKNIGVASGSASAKRLFETTGMGSCLVADITNDSQNLFELNSEIVTYSSLEDCIEKIRYLIAHPEEASKIGKKGQAKTLNEHTYRNRVDQLINILEA